MGKPLRDSMAMGHGAERLPWYILGSMAVMLVPVLVLELHTVLARWSTRVTARRVVSVMYHALSPSWWSSLR